MPTGPTMSRTEAAAKPRSANARAAASRRCGRRLVARRFGLRAAAAGDARAADIAGLDRQTLVWSSPSRQRHSHRRGDVCEIVGGDLDQAAPEGGAPAHLADGSERLQQRPVGIALARRVVRDPVAGREPPNRRRLAVAELAEAPGDAAADVVARRDADPEARRGAQSLRTPAATWPDGTCSDAFSMWPVWSSKKKSGSNSRRNSPLLKPPRNIASSISTFQSMSV